LLILAYAAIFSVLILGFIGAFRIRSQNPAVAILTIAAAASFLIVFCVGFAADAMHKKLPYLMGFGAAAWTMLMYWSLTSEYRVRMQRVLASEYRFAAIFKTSPDPICITRLIDGVIVDANPAFGRTYGWTRDEMIGHTTLEVGIWPNKQARDEFIAELRRKHAIVDMEFILVRKDGGEALGQVSTAIVEVDGLQCIQITIRDMTERQAYQRRLQSLSSRLLFLEERQRRSFAQMLDDHIGQNLMYVKMRLDMLRSQTREPAVLESAADLSRIIDELSTEAHTLTYELSPPLLYEIGLDAALEWLCEHFHTRYSLPCSFEGAGHAKKLEIDERIVLFQSAREILFNVVKHAKADSVVVACTSGDQWVKVAIRDDGAGFDPLMVKSAGGRFGLFNVKERLHNAGGEMRIESRLSGGTTVTLELPVKALQKPSSFLLPRTAS
jgi:PAS domain S-box-containing protein